MASNSGLPVDSPLNWVTSISLALEPNRRRPPPTLGDSDPAFDFDVPVLVGDEPFSNTRPREFE